MNTLPIMFPRGTVPHSRESHDWPRLSPIMKYLPAGIVIGPYSPVTCAGLRSTYGS